MDFYVELLVLCAVVWFCAKLWKGQARRNSQQPARSGALVQSFSDASVSYHIDPAQARCDCPDWTDRRSTIPTDDPRRMCKHLILAFMHEPENFPAGLQRYADDFELLGNHGKGFPSHAEQHWLSVGGRELECWTNGSPWVGVYIGAQRHAFNLDEGRWAFGKEPQGTEEIEPLLIDRFA